MVGNIKDRCVEGTLISCSVCFTIVVFAILAIVVSLPSDGGEAERKEAASLPEGHNCTRPFTLAPGYKIELCHLEDGIFAHICSDKKLLPTCLLISDTSLRINCKRLRPYLATFRAEIDGKTTKTVVLAKSE